MVDVVIRPEPKVIRRRTEKVVISPKNTLYDKQTIYTTPEEVAVIDTIDNKTIFDANAAAKKQTNNVTFSWEEPVPELTKAPPPPEPEATIQTLLKDAERDAERYVVVEGLSDKKEAPVKKSSVVSTLGDGLIMLFFLVSMLVGAYMLFNYVQESESFKRIANQLESEYISDISEKDKKDLATWQDDPSELTRRNSVGRSEAGVLSKVFPGSDDSLVKIINSKPYYLLAERKDGKIELRTGGTVGWRTNNPAEFGWGEFAKETGAIGKYSKYAIYSNVKAGLAAVQVYLFNTNIYTKLSINDAIKKFYTGNKDKAERVAKAISVALNVSRYKTIMSSLSSSQKEKVLKVIGKEEKQLAGIVRVFKNLKEFEQKGF